MKHTIEVIEMKDMREIGMLLQALKKYAHVCEEGIYTNNSQCVDITIDRKIYDFLFLVMQQTPY